MYHFLKYFNLSTFLYTQKGEKDRKSAHFSLVKAKFINDAMLYSTSAAVYTSLVKLSHWQFGLITISHNYKGNCRSESQ